MAKHSCTFHTFSLTLRLDMVVLVFDLKWCALNSFQGNQNPWKVMGSLNSVYGELFKESISMIRYMWQSYSFILCAACGLLFCFMPLMFFYYFVAIEIGCRDNQAQITITIS